LYAAGLALLLTACGGGDNPGADLPDALPSGSGEAPASAAVSIASYAQYAGSLAKTENGQPLDVNKLKPPTSETAEPVPVI
jgi:hypothetical protein